jgi:hypothetical protein
MYIKVPNLNLLGLISNNQFGYLGANNLCPEQNLSSTPLKLF